MKTICSAPPILITPNLSINLSVIEYKGSIKLQVELILNEQPPCHVYRSIEDGHIQWQTDGKEPDDILGVSGVFEIAENLCHRAIFLMAYL